MAKHIAILFFALMLNLLSLPVTVHADDSINSIDVAVLLLDDGSAQITQIWDTTRSSGTEGYIPQTGLDDIEIIDFGVTDETGTVYENIGDWEVDASLEEKADTCGINETEDGLELCWGIGSYGDHTYTLTYTMTNFIKEYTDDTFGFYSRFVNNNLSDTPDSVRVTIERADRQLTADNAAIWGFGYIGDIQFTDGKVIAKSTEPLQSESHVTVLMRLNEELVGAAAPSSHTFEEIESIATEGSDYGDADFYDDGEAGFYDDDFYYDDGDGGFFVSVNFGMFTILFIFVFIGIIVYLCSKGNSASNFKAANISKITEDEINYYRDIPMKGNLFSGYFSLKCYKKLHNQSDIISAFFLRWIQQGIIEIIIHESKGILGFGKKPVTSLYLKPATYIADPVEMQLFDIMLQAAGSDYILQEKELSHWVSNHYTTLSAWFDTAKSSGEKNFDQNGWLSERERTSFFGLHKVIEKEINDQGRQESLHLLGFKKYLLDFTLVNEREAKEVHLWDEYLIFAALFGCADTVAEQFKELNPQYLESSAYMQNDMDFFMTYMFLSSLSRTSYNAMNTAKTNSDSFRNSGGGGFSSFGGGGGGFSGGGSGGGFR